VRLRIATLPRAIALRELIVVGLTAGIGFTMSIFISGLAFPSDVQLNEAKGAVLLASSVAMIFGLTAGMLLLRRPTVPPASASEAETSDED